MHALKRSMKHASGDVVNRRDPQCRPHQTRDVGMHRIVSLGPGEVTAELRRAVGKGYHTLPASDTIHAARLALAEKGVIACCSSDCCDDAKVAALFELIRRRKPETRRLKIVNSCTIDLVTRWLDSGLAHALLYRPFDPNDVQKLLKAQGRAVA
jgi:hypothetical protein